MLIQSSQYVVGHNAPGYLCEDEPATFKTWTEARDAMIEMAIRHYDESYEYLGDIEFPNYQQKRDEIVALLQSLDDGEVGDFCVEPGVMNFFVYAAAGKASRFA